MKLIREFFLMASKISLSGNTENISEEQNHSDTCVNANGYT